MYKTSTFKSVKLTLASPENIMAWSHGEVIKPETINYRTQRPEPDGLFSERIFGPTKDWECYCGKYKRIRYKGIVCDKCGVEVTRSSVRRERMGHIKLAVPITHIWFVRGVPSSIGLVLDISVQDLEKIIYFAAYVVTEVNEKNKEEAFKEIDREFKTRSKEQKSKENIAELKASRDLAKAEIKSLVPMKVISEIEYRNLSLKFGSVFKAGIGAETVREMLARTDLKKLKDALTEELKNVSNDVVRKKITKRLRLAQGMIKAGVKPEWMCFTVLPVIPPDLRPMVQLDGGRFATSDLNDLYRRVINRNNRLKHLIELKAPEVICRNEKRMLQEALDALIDNSIKRGQVTIASTGQKRQLRSLADMLKGKQGRFRQNLLGKRVDYSGRSVIVVGPELKLNQCGLPKNMALELFKPFVMRKLIEGNYAYNVRSATRLIEQETVEVWDILENIINGKVVLLNRAPTLHRLSIQAFYPVLIEGKAIQIHPLVCKAFNADFDGDQMAVHLPLGEEAQREGREIMLSSKNLLKPATGDPIVIPYQDIILGCYYMTKIISGGKGEGKVFYDAKEAILNYQLGIIDLKAEIKLRKDFDINVIKKEEPNEGLYLKTSAGRIIFNEALPKSLRFVNEVMDAKNLKALVADSLEKAGAEETVDLVDRIKKLGFEYVTISGLSWGMSDLKIPKEKAALIEEAKKQAEIIERQYNEGLLTSEERRTKVIETWTDTKNKVTKAVLNTLDQNSPVFLMIESGARSSWAVVAQMMGMKGLVVNPAGETIELPIKNSFKEGFDVLEYFISTHGARKGMTDIALRTATAGYLTRRLVDVAQDMVINEIDCGSKKSIIIPRLDQYGLSRGFAARIYGRVVTEDIIDPKTKKVLVPVGEFIPKDIAKTIENISGIDFIKVRTVIYCKAERGICQKCYGYDLGRNKPIAKGEAIGIVTAQAIGEPGTQLTMKTFHSGGVAGRDITQGLPRVEEIFEARVPKGKALISEVSGKVVDVVPLTNKKIIRINVVDKKGKTEAEVKEYEVDSDIAISVEKGAAIKKGQRLTEGHIDIHELFNLVDKMAVVEYIIGEVQEIYTAQGEGINDKHIELIVKQMFSRIIINDAGDTQLPEGSVVEEAQFNKVNSIAKKEGKKPAKGEELLLGITKVSLSTESFLAAASFQETARVLISAALFGKSDELKGLKENVIIGKLIPAGTGFGK
ncbi:MAG: DNA-directed RNA polymerase subunit beta' [bacterium]|nr:DNA-directed RNA polymerase subunit beta' [bacterium]